MAVLRMSSGKGVWLALAGVILLVGARGAVAQDAQTCKDANGKTVTCPPGDAQPQSPQDVKKKFPFPEDESKAAQKERDSGKQVDAPADAPAAAPSGTPSSDDVQKRFPFPEEESKAAQKEREAGASPSSSRPADDSPAGVSSSRSEDDPDEPDIPSNKPGSVKLKDLGSHGDVHEKVLTPDKRFDEDLKVADFYIGDGNFKAAYARYKDALTAYPDDPRAHLGLAQMALKLNLPDEAREHFELCLKNDPEPKQETAAKQGLQHLSAKK